MFQTTNQLRFGFSQEHPALGANAQRHFHGKFLLASSTSGASGMSSLAGWRRWKVAIWGFHGHGGYVNKWMVFVRENADLEMDDELGVLVGNPQKCALMYKEMGNIWKSEAGDV